MIKYSPEIVRVAAELLRVRPQESQTAEKAQSSHRHMAQAQITNGFEPSHVVVTARGRRIS